MLNIKSTNNPVHKLPPKTILSQKMHKNIQYFHVRLDGHTAWFNIKSTKAEQSNLSMYKVENELSIGEYLKLHASSWCVQMLSMLY